MPSHYKFNLNPEIEDSFSCSSSSSSSRIPTFTISIREQNNCGTIGLFSLQITHPSRTSRSVQTSEFGFNSRCEGWRRIPNKHQHRTIAEERRSPGLVDQLGIWIWNGFLDARAWHPRCEPEQPRGTNDWPTPDWGPVPHLTDSPAGWHWSRQRRQGDRIGILRFPVHGPAQSRLRQAEGSGSDVCREAANCSG